MARIGGRAKGTPNKLTQEARELLASLNCDPIEGMALIAMGQMACRTCAGEKRTRYKTKKGDIATRVCESCYGSGREIISPELSGKMYSELAKYVYPQRKALDIEHTHRRAVDLTAYSDAELEQLRRLAERQTVEAPVQVETVN